MQLKFLLALSFCSLAGALQQKEIEEEWLNFQKQYGKKYRNLPENNTKYENFKENLQNIIAHNKLYARGQVTYKMAINPYADMNLEEMEKSYMGLKFSEKDKENFINFIPLAAPATKGLTITTSMDWRVKGAISPVKDQKACGSCWAFSSTGALEAHHFLKHNKTVLLSEQNLVDCVTGCGGCQGGWMTTAFDYVRKNDGINPESQYPYEAANRLCRFQSEHIAATCQGYVRTRQNDEKHMQEVVTLVGPVAVAIDVNTNFMKYTEGIYDDPTCTKAINHAVLVVGFGEENGQDYWLVKNSWGSQWGNGGYIKMARNKDNQCAIASYGSYPLV